VAAHHGIRIASRVLRVLRMLRRGLVARASRRMGDARSRINERAAVLRNSGRRAGRERACLT
jgi:hypothetical protein